MPNNYCISMLIMINADQYYLFNHERTRAIFFEIYM